MLYYKQPSYFNAFTCTGSSCADNCCHGWVIYWTTDEVNNVLNAAECSDALKIKIESSFIKSEKKDRYTIKFDDNGNCPLLTDNRLCMLQRELGADYLSHTCSSYPRIIRRSNEIYYRCCNLSCSEIVRILFNDSKCMNIVNAPLQEFTTMIITDTDSKEDMINYPQVKYRNGIFDFFYEIISDKKHDVETSIVLGALAAQKLTQVVEAGRVEELPDIVKKLRPQLHNAANIRSIENIAPNYYIKFGLLVDIFKKLTTLNTLDYLYDDEGKLNITLYDYGERRFKEAFADREFATRNVALNLLFELGMPFIFKEKSIFDNYSIFVTAFALIKLNLFASAEWVDVNNAFTSEEHTAASPETLEEEICKRMAIIGRTISHNKQNLMKILAILKANKTSPAYLALLVK